MLRPQLDFVATTSAIVIDLVPAVVIPTSVAYTWLIQTAKHRGGLADSVRSVGGRTFGSFAIIAPLGERKRADQLRAHVARAVRIGPCCVDRAGAAP